MYIYMQITDNWFENEIGLLVGGVDKITTIIYDAVLTMVSSFTLFHSILCVQSIAQYASNYTKYTHTHTRIYRYMISILQI